MNIIAEIFYNFLFFINQYLIPLIFALAFVTFLYGVYTFFIRGGDNPDKVKKGRDFVVYGLIGFFLMFSVWGIVNLLVRSFGFVGQTRPMLPSLRDNLPTIPTRLVESPFEAIDGGESRDPFKPEVIKPISSCVWSENCTPVTCMRPESALCEPVACTTDEDCIAFASNGSTRNENFKCDQQGGGKGSCRTKVSGEN